MFISTQDPISKEEWEHELLNGAIGMQSGRSDAVYMVYEGILYSMSFTGVNTHQTEFSKLGLNSGMHFYIVNDLRTTLELHLSKKEK